MSKMNELRKGSIREVISNIYEILTTDPLLIQLLSNKEIEDMSKEEANAFINPSNSAYWETVDHCIKTFNKPSDIEEDVVNRIYIYAGRRRPVFNNYLVASQEIVIDIFVNEKYDDDMRLFWIIDRVNELIALRYVDGAIGKLEYAAGNPRVAPIGFSMYESIYVYTTGKK